jgi:hypothetical protein
MPLFQNGTATDKPIGSEVQVETLPEIYPPRGVAETDTAWNARVATWNARTRTITYIVDDGSLLGVKQTTAPIAFNATAATIQTAMTGLAGIGAGNMVVAGSGRTFEYAFSGTLANKAFKRMFHRITDSGIVSYFETVVAGVSQAMQQAIKQDATGRALAPIAGANDLTNMNAATPKDIGDPARYATTGRQYVETYTGTVTGGTRTLTVNGQTTTAIAFGASAATIQAALEALNNVAPGDVTVTSSGAGSYTYEWMGALTGKIATMTVDPSLLTGGGTSTLSLTREGTIGTPKFR